MGRRGGHHHHDCAMVVVCVDSGRCSLIEYPPSSSVILLIKVLRDSGVGALILLSSEGRGLAWCFLPTV